MLYKKNDYNYEKYNKWYSYCKFLLRNAIYDEIIKNNKINQYNIYKYILDTDTNIKKNIHYESSVNKEIQHIKCSYQEDTLTPIDISKEELLKNLTYRDKLWNIYTGYDDYKIPDNIVLFINELFEFYKKIKFFDNGISYITPIMEFYKIVKNNKDINFDANINYIITSRQIPNEDNYGNNDEEEYGNFICLCVLLLMYQDKKERFFDSDNHDKKYNNWKTYLKIFAKMPIINHKYIKTLDDIMYDLYLYIEYLPDVDFYHPGDPQFTGIDKTSCAAYLHGLNKIKIYVTEAPNECSEKHKGKLFYKMISKTLNQNIKQYKFSLNGNDENNFILKSIFCDFNFFDNTDILYYEQYGYTNTNNKIMGVDKADKNIVERFSYEPNVVGTYHSYQHKLYLFIKKIEDELNEKNQLDMQKYIIYFYLCNISGTEMKQNIFDKYDGSILNYFIDLWPIKIQRQKQEQHYDYYIYQPIIYAYVLKYNKSYSFNSKYLILNDNILIHYIERNLFKQKIYTYSIQQENIKINNTHDVSENYCKSEFIDFFILKYKFSKNVYNIIIHKNTTTNTIESINIIKKIQKVHNNMYLALNFYYKYTNYDNQEIIGYNKYDKNITITGSLNMVDSLKYNYKNTQYDIINYSKYSRDSQYGVYYNFFSKMTYNDLLILMYKLDNVVYLNFGSYNITFYMKENNIYYDIDDNTYNNTYNVNIPDEDTYNVYGIIKLVNVNNSDNNKLLCFYNYRHIPILLETPEFNFVGEKKSNVYNDAIFSSDVTIPKYKTFFHSIINEHKINNKQVYILKNFNDALAILLNCFTYNNYSLILKTARQLQTIIKNNNINIKILNTFTNKCKDIYGLPVRELLYYELKEVKEVKEMEEMEEMEQLKIYNYKYFNHLYKKYDIAFKFDFYSDSTLFQYTSSQMTTQHDPKYVYYDCNNDCEYKYTKNDGEIIYIYGKDKVNKYIYKIKDNTIYASADSSTIKKHIMYDSAHSRMNEADYFNLLSVHIKNPSKEKFNSNVEIAKKLFEYLNSNNRVELYPIQELIMGSGKSSVITPYLIKLLLEKAKKEIYIVMPNSLILQSFETLMKNLFPIFNDVQIRIKNDYDINNENSEQTATIYLMDDVQFKLKFLENKVNSDNMYVIYDEVDMIANPLSCELNIPDQITDLQNVNTLFEITEMLYNNIFNSEKFWKNKNYITNGKHKYFPKIDVKLNEYINKFYDDATTNFKNKCKSLVVYIKLNVLIFILTKQFNYDYGMPESYENIECTDNYKYKAIPYIAADLPALGSEFSDPVLTYVLTYFCYKIADQKYRYIDKIFIINYLESEYDKQDIHFKKFTEQFTHGIQSWKTYFDNREFYLKSMKEKFNLEDTTQIIILKNILNMNISYYKKCNNISFNDLLLYKNVRNFVSFTGTAFIKPPRDISNNFPEKYIERSQIKINNKVHENTEKAIEYLLNDRNITEHNFINDDNNTTIEAIFECLGSYSVLIDIGALFVNYNNQEFINEYKKVINRKQYIVYYENERKILNIETGVYETSASIKNQNTFFYFSNKNITGVDMKDIMEPKAYGLVTITNNTSLRDFSQGVFRMRDILNGQKIDLIIDKKMVSEANEIFEILFGGNYVKRTPKDTVLKHVYTHLQKIQNEYDNQKNKILYKQNIFALIKSDTCDGKQILYIDPSSSDYKGKDINDVNIENIITKRKPEYNDIINKLKTDYDNLIKVNTTNQNQIQSKTQEKTHEKTQEKTQEKSVTMSIIKYEKNDNRQPFIPYNIGKNIITVAFIPYSEYKHNLFILYKDENKILAIVDEKSIDNFFLYNSYEDVKKCTFISFHGNTYYGNPIDEKIITIIKIIAKNIYNNLVNQNRIFGALCDKCGIYTKTEIDFMTNNKTDIDAFLKHFTQIFT